jgi:hypothetical protein
MSNKVEIVAQHPAFGTVTFLIDAEDGTKAFSLWKQIIYSSRQWIVKSNNGAKRESA